MNHLVDIEYLVELDDPDPQTGERVSEWQTFKANVFCDIKASSVKSYIQSRAEQSDISVQIKIPFIRGLDSIGEIESNMRLVGVCGCHEGRIYNPKGILEDNMTAQEYVTLPCSQGVNRG